MKLAVITYQDRGAYAVETVPDEDKLLSEILDSLSIEYQFEIWSDESVKWQQYDMLLLKSPWDYFDYFPKFAYWCEQIQSLGIPVLNDLRTVLWNSKKSYLLEIQQAGLGVVPTKLIPMGDVKELVRIVDNSGSDSQFVIKPAISGGSKNTLKFALHEFADLLPTLGKWLSVENYLLQPFVPEIERVGEYSYIYFNGKFSHALLKKASPGEFRVQHFFGGTIHSLEPGADELASINPYIEHFAISTLYARVDGVWRDGVFLLMELELIEPYLFLYTHPQAMDNYRSAIKARLQVSA
ncbi:ATP-grasp domain-containing protein [Mongoliitalea lutea]|nr:glutathione synthetase [Mongoliitalea lutea]